MSNISVNKTVASDRWLVTGEKQRAIVEPETCNLKPDKEKLLVSMKEKAVILRHLQEKDIVKGADARELQEVLADLDKTIKELETSNV